MINIIPLLVRIGDSDIICRKPKELFQLTAEFTLGSLIPQMFIHKIYGKCVVPNTYFCNRNKRINDRANKTGYCKFRGKCGYKETIDFNQGKGDFINAKR